MPPLVVTMALSGGAKGVVRGAMPLLVGAMALSGGVVVLWRVGMVARGQGGEVRAGEILLLQGVVGFCRIRGVSSVFFPFSHGRSSHDA